MERVEVRLDIEELPHPAGATVGIWRAETEDSPTVADDILTGQFQVR
jgi:hypothetical protein